MSDNKKLKDKPDRARVDAHDPSEVEYLHRKFPERSHADIVAAIRQYGPFRKLIVRGLLREANEV